MSKDEYTHEIKVENIDNVKRDELYYLGQDGCWYTNIRPEPIRPEPEMPEGAVRLDSVRYNDEFVFDEGDLRKTVIMVRDAGITVTTPDGKVAVRPLYRHNIPTVPVWRNANVFVYPVTAEFKVQNPADVKIPLRNVNNTEVYRCSTCANTCTIEEHAMCGDHTLWKPKKEIRANHPPLGEDKT